MAEQKKGHGKLSIHTENIFPIIKKWLYSEHDIFLRELVSNSVDAMSKRTAIEPELDREQLKIEIKSDKKAKTLQIIDNGIGMTREEVKKYINQIAFSGAEEFVDKYKEKQNAIIGHFGLGFYSTFMVSDKVTIDTLSREEGAEPAYWECEGDIKFKTDIGKHKEVGTTVTLYLNSDSEEYLEDSKLRELVEKYSNFMPFPIYINKEKEPVNQKEALWNKQPKDVTDEEYKEYYKKMYHDWQDPLFWLHLNVDYPFNLKGILYFPAISNQLDINRGSVNLYCNNVFVADNLKGFIPEFMMLLKGGIDIPDIPLNVSRSFLQNDKQVQKITGYIVKKVADSLKEVFESDRKRYEGFWKDIQNFIKYGFVTDDKFLKAMKDHLIFKSTNDDWVTLQEYLDRNEQEGEEKKVYYANGTDLQVSYIEMMKQQGLEVIYSDSVIDNHVFQKLEMEESKVKFVRVDSEINDNLVEADKAEVADAQGHTSSERLQDIFDRTLNPDVEASFSKDDYAKFIKDHQEAVNTLAPHIRNENDFTYIKIFDLNPNEQDKLGAGWSELRQKAYLEVTTKVKHLKSGEIPAMIVFDEQMRRMQEMNTMFTGDGFDMLRHHTLVVNAENETVQKVLDLGDNNETEKVELVVNYLHELALLEQKQFSGKELQKFINRSNEILKLVN
ncbi:MAG: molecular chaperone HtpG [Candidatus Stygibacter australis]|nr:molecular chaperone HtpG [Candidatus Stygibacter australis]